jgi:peptide/nickel transport system substrate-binding protein
VTSWPALPRAGRASLAALLLVLVFAVSCARAPEEARAPAAGDIPEAERFGGTLVIGAEADADAIVPTSAFAVTGTDVMARLFASLGRTNDDMVSYRPELAASWDTTADGKSLTFHLRPDARWHDGAPIRAGDVVFTLDACRDPRAAWPHVRWLEHITGVTALDSLTVRFDFDAVYPYMLMDANVARPMPRHLLGGVAPESLRSAAFNRAPVGSGPFRFAEWRPQERIVLDANRDAFDGRPYVDRIVWKIIPDQTRLLEEIKSGEIDVYCKVPPHAVAALETNPAIRVVRVPSRSYVFLGWQNTHAILRDRDVRRALGMAVDRKRIFETLAYGLGTLTPGPIMPFQASFDSTAAPLPYDPAESRRLLAAAGFRDADGDGVLERGGKPFVIEMLTNANSELRKEIIVAVQEDLAKVGVKIVPAIAEWTTYVDRLNTKRFESVCGGWSVSIKEDLSSVWHSRAIAGNNNNCSFSNATADSLLDLLATERDPERRKAINRAVQRILIDDAPACFLFNLDDVHAFRSAVRNARPTTYSWANNIERWYLAPGERRER